MRTKQRKRIAPMGLSASATGKNTDRTRVRGLAEAQQMSHVEEVPLGQFPSVAADPVPTIGSQGELKFALLLNQQ